MESAAPPRRIRRSSCNEAPDQPDIKRNRSAVYTTRQLGPHPWCFQRSAAQVARPLAWAASERPRLQRTTEILRPGAVLRGQTATKAPKGRP